MKTRRLQRDENDPQCFVGLSLHDSLLYEQSLRHANEGSETMWHICRGFELMVARQKAGVSLVTGRSREDAAHG